MKKLLTAVAVAGLSFGAFAADEQDYTQWVTLTNSDSTTAKVYSFAAAGYWSDGAEPSADKDYYVPAGRTLMTSTSGKSSPTFNGRHLALGGTVRYRCTASPYQISMGPGGILLPGSAVQFDAAGNSFVGSVSVESTVESPAVLRLNSKTGDFNINCVIRGAAGTALKLFSPGSAPLAETFRVLRSAFTNYLGTIVVSKNVGLTFDSQVAQPVIPGTLNLTDGGWLLSEAYGPQIVIGTLAVDAGAMMKWSFTANGLANVVSITNELVFADEAKLKVQFAEWHPHLGAQKYPILKLTGAAADSDVTADDFVLDITSPMWRDLPKTDNPQIAIDETADGKVVSVEWPDEPEPFAYLDEDGNLVLDTATQYGNFVDDLSDGDTPLSVLKKGEGAAQIGPNSPFTGTIDVREGKLIVGNKDWEFYRWVIQSTYNWTSTSTSSTYKKFGMRSFGLFDAEGNDRAYGMTHTSNEWTIVVDASSRCYTSKPYSYDADGMLDMKVGHFKITRYDGTQQSVAGILDNATNIFAHSDWADPGLWVRKPSATIPSILNTNSWIAITVRLPVGAPVTSWDYVNSKASTTSGGTGTYVSNCVLQVSRTGKEWETLSTVVREATKPTDGTWQGDASTYVAGYDTHTGGMPLDSQYPADPILFAATKVSVAEGATLEAHTGTAPVLDDLEIDLDKGLGTIKGFAFAATGTLRITNTYGLRDIRIAADLNGVAGYENLVNWTILIDGKDKTRARTVTVTDEGIAISPKGLVIIVAGNAGGAPASSFLSPTDGAVVPLLNARQKEFLTWTPNEICEAISNEVARKAAGETIPKTELLEKIGTGPLAVDFRWRPGLGKVLLTVAKKGAETTPFFRDYVTEGSVSLKNFEVGTRYVATLKGVTVDETIEFETEDLAPRCIALSGRSNTRDLGGRTLPNGRRVRQGLMYRTGEFEEAGVMKISEETRKYIVETLGIKTDIDLRQDSVVQPIVDAGRVSPLGPTVEWIHEWENYYGYQAVHTTGADATKRIFKYFGDRTKYPIVFHCAGGADRTGSVAFLLQGVLGASDDQILKDYLVTGWGAAIIGNNYPKWLWQTVRSFDGFEGETLSARICAYFKETLGFTEAELDAIRDIMLED